ncbi:MAG TPA: trigger factor [Deltaproteobacteria bacterium]|nr:trigger factor [Deltaproteobacteria bacterium]
MENIAADVTIEEVSSIKKKLSFDIPWRNVKHELDSAYDAVGRQVKIKGFRPGKVPRKILELHYRQDAEREALSNLIEKHYEDAVRKHNLPVIAQPEIDQQGIEQGENFSFTAMVEIRPEVEPHDYEGLEVARDEIDVADGDVDDRIDQMRDMYATLESVKELRESKQGDFLVIDFEVTVDGEIRQELTTENYSIEIGGGKFIPGFEEQLTGLKKDDEKTVDITFPDDYEPAELAGKQGFFKVVVKDIQEKKVPPLDDEFIKNFDTFESMEDLREAVKKSMVDEATQKTNEDLRKNIISALLEKHEFEVPSIWIERQIYRLMLDAQQRMMSPGLGKDKATELSWSMRESFRPHAEQMMKTALLFEKIAEKEAIAVDDAEVEARIDELMTVNGQRLDQVREVFENEEARERLRDEILENKILDFLIDKAHVTVEHKSFADLQKEST